ncbi:MAG: SRPBCC domain-containing protein [Planctomycetes bacterium]|nr:SRPBCC domain-containing protein [Planctomycetota bacterium]
MKTVGKLTLATPGDREIVMTRVFDAPRAKVFEALTTPALLKRWLFAPPGWALKSCVLDLQAGGAYRFEMSGPGGGMSWGGVFREVAVPERFVATERFEPAWYEGEALVTQALSEKDGRTTLTLTVKYESREARDGALKFPMEQGVAAGYDKLEELVK